MKTSSTVSQQEQAPLAAVSSGTESGPAKPKFERLGECLYWRGAKIVARVRVNGKATWRGTGTENPAEARKWLKKWRSEEWAEENGFEPKGVVLHRERATVGELIDTYIEAGMPTRKMQQKAARSVLGERYAMNPVRAYFGNTPAASLTLGDCDKYLDWRTSGGYVAKFTVRGKPQTMQTRGGKRAVDLELVVLSNALNLAVRRGVLSSNPLAGRGRYTCASEVRHCREVAPSPAGLAKIETWLRGRKENGVADVVCFLAYSGLRIGEALAMEWEMVSWAEKLLHVKREKKGITPWVPLLSEMESLLRDMQKRAISYLLFPSPFDPAKPVDASAIRRRLGAACVTLDLGHVTPHGLRSYFVTQARQSGLSDAEIAALIGDKTGPAIIATTYGDVRPDHLLKQAQRIRLTVQASQVGESGACSIKRSIMLPDVSAVFGVAPGVANVEQRPGLQGV